MKRRLACIVLAALLLLGLCCTAFAEAPAATEAQLWNITDTVGLLTSDEDQSLEERAEEISAKLAALAYIKQDAESLRQKGEERERLKREYQALQAAISKAQGEAEGLARREEEIKKKLKYIRKANS